MEWLWEIKVDNSGFNKKENNNKNASETLVIVICNVF